MKIVLWGVETKNKGAELMFYAILQEIEKKFPNAEVFIPHGRLRQGLDYMHTNVNLKYWPYGYFVHKLRLKKIFRILHLPQSLLLDTYAISHADYFIDGSGFAFSDQWNIKNERVEMWQKLLDRMHRQGTKIVFLPQAFGPIELPNTKRVLTILNKYANIIMPREKVSYNYLAQSGVVDMNKVKLYTDFTSLVEGEVPDKFSHLRNGVCVIPNLRMIDKGAISMEKYIDLIREIILETQSSGKKVYLLNHEGINDEKLCYQVSEAVQNSVEVVTGLNALEVKGLISSAYLVISSRFHGVASALNSCVPCLSTSWSHKYQELYNDYNMNDCILPLDNNMQAMEQIRKHLNTEKNIEIRNILNEQVPHIKDETREMWRTVWSI